VLALQFESKMNQIQFAPCKSRVNPVIGCSKNVLRLISSTWPLSDWLMETVGGIHLFVDLSTPRR